MPVLRLASLIISIHAPPRGATWKYNERHAIDLFQFTPLREGRRVRKIKTIDDPDISIHAPPRGATGCPQKGAG